MYYYADNGYRVQQCLWSGRRRGSGGHVTGWPPAVAIGAGGVRQRSGTGDRRTTCSDHHYVVTKRSCYIVAGGRNTTHSDHHCNNTNKQDDDHEKLCDSCG